MRAKLVKKQQETSDISSYFFEPEDAFDYTPGAFVYLSLPGIKSDRRGDIRHLSFSSSPTENLLRLTVKDGRSEYKNILKNLKKGSIVDIDGPHGVYQWDYPDSIPHIFIAGGVGITPFRSRIKFNIDKNKSAAITLLYSYSVAGAFTTELTNWQSRHQFLKYLPVNTKNESRISPQMLSEIKLVKNEIIWICGSTNFVNALEDMLLEIRIEADQIKTEKFTGY